MLGFLIDLIELGRKSLSEVLVWTIFTGWMAVFYLLTIIRSPRWLLFPLGKQADDQTILLFRVLV